MAAPARLKQVTHHIAPSVQSTVSRVDGHVVIITGAAQGTRLFSNSLIHNLNKIVGIGKSAALLLAQHGAKVFLSDLDEMKLKETTKELLNSGYEARYFVGDVLDEQFATNVVKSALTQFGKINCLINNAGMYFKC